MTSVKLLFGFGAALMLFAEAAIDPIGSWGQLTALGIVAVVLVFIVTRILPDIHEKFVRQSIAFSEAMTKAQADFSLSVEKIAQRQHEDSVLLSGQINSLREHCAAARAALEGRSND